ncbi:MAG: FAD-dependent oxidoreductase, partial [Patescibacteria group bacterium]
MHKYDFLIIGGGIAGTTAAETIRRKDVSSSVAIIEDEPHFLYSRVFLPAF